jgi:chromosome segregation ATPase
MSDSFSKFDQSGERKQQKTEKGETCQRLNAKRFFAFVATSAKRTTLLEPLRQRSEDEVRQQTCDTLLIVSSAGSDREKAMLGVMKKMKLELETKALENQALREKLATLETSDRVEHGSDGAALEALQSEISQLRNERDELKTQADELRRRAQSEKAHAQMSLLAEQERWAAQSESALREATQQREMKISVLERRLAAMKEEFEQEQKNVNQERARAGALREQLDAANAHVASLQARSNALESKQSDEETTRRERLALEQHLKQLSEASNRAIAELNVQNENLAAQNSALEQQFGEARQRCIALEEASHAIETRASAERDALTKQAGSLELQLNSKLALLEREVLRNDEVRRENAQLLLQLQLIQSSQQAPLEAGMSLQTIKNMVLEQNPLSQRLSNASERPYYILLALGMFLSLVWLLSGMFG